MPRIISAGLSDIPDRINVRKVRKKNGPFRTYLLFLQTGAEFIRQDFTGWRGDPRTVM